MSIGIDWVSAAILGAAFLLSMVRAVPARVRLWVTAAACFAVAGWRLHLGADRFNLLLVGLIAVVGVTYAVQAIRAPR